MKLLFLSLLAANAPFFTKSAANVALQRLNDKRMLDTVQRAHFEYFLDNQHPDTGLILDRSRAGAPCNISAVGFALTAYPVAVQRRWVSREAARAYTLKVLRALSGAPQGCEPEGRSGYNGFFYRFLDPATATRYVEPSFGQVEVSTVDTAFLMAGVLFARDYYSRNNAVESEIRALADMLYRRVNWCWALVEDELLVTLGWLPESGFLPYRWRGYDEAMMIFLLGLGSPTHPLPDGVWEKYLESARLENHFGRSFLVHPPMFVYQYTHVWVDFRGIRDEVGRALGFDYFENSRRAALANRAYAIANPHGFQGYSALDWGLSASDGPGTIEKTVDGRLRRFHAYEARGPGGTDDGTIAPTAVCASLPFAPEIVLPTMRHWLRNRTEIFRRGGFVPFNPTFSADSPSGWIAPEQVGIDQGPVVLMIENYRSDFVWRLMRKNAVIRHGLKRAGFQGGWLVDK